MEHIRDDLLDEISGTDGIQRKIEMTAGIIHPNIRISWNTDGIEDFVEFDNMDAVAGWLREHGYEYRAANYRNVSRVYENTLFLTQKAAAAHLEANDYHYSGDAHTYAMTSWRNKEAEMLWKILRQVDWGRLLTGQGPEEREKENVQDVRHPERKVDEGDC